MTKEKDIVSHSDGQPTMKATNTKTGETVILPSDGTPVNIAAEQYGDIEFTPIDPGENPASGTIDIDEPESVIGACTEIQLRAMRGGTRPGAGRPVQDIPDAEKKSQIAVYMKRGLIAGIKAITKDRSAFISDLVEVELKRRGKL